jgi:cytoskeleton protein RodZ
VSDSIGTLLATARAAKGVSLAEAATQLRCDEVLLRALEADRFEELGAPVFVQGHLRRYADYLGASTEQLMGAWATLRAEKLAEPDLARIPRAPVRAVDPKVWTRRAVAVGLTVLIAAAAWLILGWGSSSVPAPVAATPAPVAEPPPTAVPATTPVTTPTIAPAPAAPTPVAEAASEPESESAPAPAQIAAPTPVSTGAAVLRLVPRQPSWIEVYDASNRRRYYGNAAAGTPLALRGEAPFSVVLGRADAVAIELDGRPITLPAAFVYNATAFVTIDAAGNVQRAAARNTRSTAP